MDQIWYIVLPKYRDDLFPELTLSCVQDEVPLSILELMHVMSEYLHGDDYSSVLFQYIYEKSLAKKTKNGCDHG